MSTTMDGRYLHGIRISGAAYSGQLEHITSSASFSMSTDEITQMSFTFLDDVNLSLFRSRLMDKGSTITYAEWSLTVDKVDLTPTDVGPALAVSALSTFAHKWQSQHGARTWTNVDVTQWYKERCQEVGAVPVIQPGLGRKTIVRESSLEMGFQNTWEVMSQVRRELGAVMFERGNKLVVGRPTWIIRQHTQFQEWPLWWNNWSDYSPALTGMPTYTGRTQRRAQEELSFQLASRDADRIRPGDHVLLRGTSVGPMGGSWMVSRVGFPMTNIAPVDVTCVRPVDPPKEESTTTSGLGAAAAAPGAFDTSYTISLSTLPATVAGYSGTQLVNAAHIIRAAVDLGLPKRAMQIAVMVGIAESTLRVLNYGDAAAPDARGVFQQAVTGWGTYQCRMDPYCSATAFLQKLKTVTAWETSDPALVAHTVQVNPTPEAYRPAWSPAVKVVDAILATATTGPGASPSIGGAPAELSAAVDRYVNRVRGLAIDHDGQHGAQCVDLSMHYTIAMGGPQIYGNGRDWWNTGRASGFYNGIAANDPARKGDVACWGTTMGGGWGHVAIVLQDQGSTLRVLTQNPGPPAIRNLTKNGLDGYLRPKTWR